jgi:serine O-acetyltransferase
MLQLRDICSIDKMFYMHFSQLKSYWHAEVIGTKKSFSYWRIFTRLRNKPSLSFLFWWRLANYLYSNGHKRTAYRIHSRLKARFACDIMLGATIGEGLSIAHHVGIVISKRVIAGKNLQLTQNTIIGKSGNSDEAEIVIGDNVFIGTNSCIIGDFISIGDNVTIAAMSFVNKDIPSNSKVITKKITEVKDDSVRAA